ncbi:hypothetical protein [Miltoncostaea marina]|uniref:hypothetical protein n=1 Tax=Miltoncostaea marina TaxID=2843215 RepID=UPI001C3E2D98|nr:hypothetical protein [Miltoncostaea marina]
MRHSTKRMWVFAALVAAIIALAAVGAGGWLLLLVVGCIAVMGAMVWMMLGGAGDGRG